MHFHFKYKKESAIKTTQLFIFSFLQVVIFNILDIFHFRIDHFETTLFWLTGCLLQARNTSVTKEIDVLTCKCYKSLNSDYTWRC